MRQSDGDHRYSGDQSSIDMEQAIEEPGDTIVVVGPCGSGKSTLVEALETAGFPARAVAQEHSVIHELWRHGGRPLALVALQAQPKTITERRGTEFPDWLHEEQMERLASAYEHADLIIETDSASPQDIATTVVQFLREVGVEPGEQS